MLRRVVISSGLVVILLAAIIAWPEFFDLSSLLLTLGGAVTVTALSYSKQQLRALISDVYSLLTVHRYRLNDHIGELSRLTRLFQLEGLRGLESQEGHLTDPFLKQGVSLLIDLRRQDEIHARLEYELSAILGQREISKQILVTLSKLLPAFGLIGTLVGMVLLLKNITGQDTHLLPSALSLAVMNTLYGAVLSNVVVAPLAARLQASLVEKEIAMRLSGDWVMMLARGESAAAITNKLNPLVRPLAIDASRDREWLPMIVSAQR